MASVNKLSLRGVRSFSPEDEEQVVEFSFPCTIIVGANGCGKTTIIESLKYAVSGSLPPGNKAGQSFVHDPRSIGQSVVKANIKLRITNRAGAPMVVIRSMEVAQKKTTMSFKQLDGVLRTMDPNTGERVSLSHKCSELDRQIPALLGVSKPILEHVIFCHQEDSSWPLMEGAVLKKRFDDIFDSTRYSKALESFRKTKKDLQSQVKDHKADVCGLASHKYAAKGFRQEKGKQHEILEELEEDMVLFNQQIKASQEQIQHMKAIIQQVETIRYEIEGKQNKLQNTQSLSENQRIMLDEDLTSTHTVEQLKQMILDFDVQVQSQKEKMEELERDCAKIKHQIAKLRQQEIDTSKKSGKLEIEKDTYERNMKERYQKMETIANTYAIDLQTTQLSQNSLDNTTLGGGGRGDISLADETILGHDGVGGNGIDDVTVSQDDMRVFFQTIKRKEVQLKETLKKHKARARLQEDELQSILAELHGKFKSVENERKKLSVEQTESQREIQTLTQISTSHSRIRKSDIEDSRRQATRVAKERDQANQDTRRTQIPTEIRSLENKIDKLKRHIEDEQFTVSQLRDSVEAQNAVTVLQEQVTKDMECLLESLQEQSFTLQQRNITMPKMKTNNPNNNNNKEQEPASEEVFFEAVDAIVNTIKEKLEDAIHELDSTQNEVAKTQQLVSENSAIFLHKRQTLNQLRMQLDKLDRNGNVKLFTRIAKEIKLTQGAGGSIMKDEQDPQEVLSYLNKRLEEIEEESALDSDPESVPRIMKKLKKLAKMIGDDGEVQGFRCPCCLRGMDHDEISLFQQSMVELADYNESPLIKVDPLIIEAQRALKMKFQTWRKKVSVCMNDVNNYQRIVSEANELEPVMEELEKSLSTKKENASKAKNMVAECQTEVEELRQLLDHSRRWSENANRIGDKNMQINQKQYDLNMSMSNIGGDGGGDRDLKSVERSLNEHVEEKDSYGNKINRLNKEMTNLNNRMTQLSDQAARMEKLVRDREAKFSKEQEAAERKKVLTSRISTIAEEEKKLQEQLAPIRSKVRTKESEKQRLRAHATSEEEKDSEILNNFLSDMKHLTDLTKMIDAYSNSDKEDELNCISSEISTIINTINERESQQESIEGELEKVVKAFDDQERHKRMLKQNIDLLALEARIESMTEKLEELETEEANIEGHENCREILESAAKKKQRSDSSKARLEGRRGEMVEQIRSLNRKLSSQEYKDIDERHRVAMIKHETTQIAVEDLDKYAGALDKALLRFHSIKIGDINKIIKELWILTYKGEDINNIEIVSGHDSGSRASKSYNYRVVMTKGDTKLDMRGRCSAGQRVLASIVIRLALAETFGVNFGCIALDEPTVNLDYNNKKGLAIALAQIVAARALQRNFQLILITHDEDFVVMMKTELATQSGFPMPEKYFQVRREEGADGKFYSKIDAIDWDELL